MYNSAIYCAPKWDKAHFCLGKYYDELLAAEANRRSARIVVLEEGKSSGSSKTRTTAANAFDSTAKFLYTILKHYGSSLSFGNKYLFQAMPRMLTLWFEHSEHWSGNVVPIRATQPSVVGVGSTPSTPSGRGGGASSTVRPVPVTLEEKFSQCHDSMMELVRNLAPFQWLTAFPQIISRLTHSNLRVYQFIKDIIVRVFVEYPQQAMWMLAVVIKSVDPERL